MSFTGLRQHYLQRSQSGFALLVDIGCCLAFLVAVAYLLFKIVQVSEYPGYDFKYLWLAGDTWLQGFSAYSDHYQQIGQQLQLPGYIPNSFYYPPNWFLPVTAMGLSDPASAFFYWNCFNVAALLGASLLLSRVFRESLAAAALPQWLAPVTGSPANLFFLHVFFVAVFQATAMTLSTGQTSILIYLGVSLLLYGVRFSRAAAVAGLTILWLKPQLGIVFTLALLMQGRQHWRLIIYTAAISIALCLPALVISPLAPLEWLGKIGHYDDQLTAYPLEMTGIRHLLWLVSGFDTGNLGALLVTLLALPCLNWISGGFGVADDHLRTLSLSQKSLLIASAVLTALGPLHFYDFLLVAVFIYLIVIGRPLAFYTGALGAVLILRADDVASLTGFYNADTLYFKGSTLGTLAALMLLFAVCLILRRASTRSAAAT